MGRMPNKRVQVTNFHRKMLKVLYFAGDEGRHRDDLILELFGELKIMPSGNPSKSSTIVDNLYQLKKNLFVIKKKKRKEFGRPKIYWYITELGINYIQKFL